MNVAPKLLTGILSFKVFLDGPPVIILSLPPFSLDSNLFSLFIYFFLFYYIFIFTRFYFIFTFYMYMYSVAIPTYNRSDIIYKKTLSTLLNGGVNYKNIFIFVANKIEYQKYEEVLPKECYNKIIIGKIGIAKQRTFIRNYFKEGEYVVSIDDDVEEVLQLKNNKLAKIKDLHTFFMKAYEDLKREKRYLWGIYPVKNPFFMKNTLSDGLTFVIGVLHGYIVRHLNSLTPNTQSEGKEDYEQSILYYNKDGGVLRYNYITIKTKFLAKGGLGEDRFETNKKAAEYLFKKYPKFITIFYRKNGMTEVKLRDKSSKTRKLSPFNFSS